MTKTTIGKNVFAVKSPSKALTQTLTKTALVILAEENYLKKLPKSNPTSPKLKVCPVAQSQVLQLQALQLLVWVDLQSSGL